MRKLTAAFLTLSSSTLVFAAWFDQALNLSSRWLTDRESVEDRIVDNYTDDETGEVNESGIDANTREIQKFVDLVTAG